MEPKRSFQIRRIKNSEIPLIHAIEIKCFTGPRAYSRSQLNYLVKRANSLCLVALVNSVICGFIIVTFRKNTNIAMIETLDVHPDCQNQGIGSSLLKEVEIEMRLRGIKKSQLEVSDRNVNALWIYKKAGYEVMDFLDKYYIFDNMGSTSAVRMIKALH